MCVICIYIYIYIIWQAYTQRYTLNRPPDFGQSRQLVRDIYTNKAPTSKGKLYNTTYDIMYYNYCTVIM